MRIARVFPTQTSFTPVDQDAYYDAPDLFTPHYDEVHVSVVFTWDRDKADRLAEEWRDHGEKVRMGGPAIDGESKDPMVAGMYIKKGITITSRGCIKNCPFCMVRKELIELDYFPGGNIVQDNNLLACSSAHLDKVFAMLENERQIEFRGGIDKYLVSDSIARALRKLHTKEIWMACDSDNEVEALRNAVNILKKVGFTREHLYCYVLIGKDMVKDEERLRGVYDAGALPFAQLFRDREDSIKYSKEWKRFHRLWSRPALYRRLCAS